jgi:hypothetical protein
MRSPHCATPGLTDEKIGSLGARLQHITKCCAVSSALFDAQVLQVCSAFTVHPAEMLHVLHHHEPPLSKVSLSSFPQANQPEDTPKAYQQTPLTNDARQTGRRPNPANLCTQKPHCERLRYTCWSTWRSHQLWTAHGELRRPPA